MTKLEDIEVVQITDTHIMAEGEHYEQDVNAKTDVRLKAIIEHINNRPIPPALVIHTGDIVDNGGIDSYIVAKSILDKLKVEYFLTCGNHDNFSNLKDVFKKHNYFVSSQFAHYFIDLPELRLVILDSKVSGEAHGLLCDARIVWLEEVLASSNKATIIFLHHYPVKLGNKLFDSIKLLDCDKFLQVLFKNKHVLGLYCGHYHHHFTSSFAEKSCWISPSVAPTHIIKNSKCVGLNYSSPAYSVHKFNGKGKLTSTVIKLRQD